MSLWLKIDTTRSRNRKTYRLADLLAAGSADLFGGRDATSWRAIALALLEDFWAFVAEHHPNGDVTHAHGEALREAVRPWVEGSEWATKDVRVLLEQSGHIDRKSVRGHHKKIALELRAPDAPPTYKLVVHDWLEWTGSDMERLANERKRKRLARAKRPRTVRGHGPDKTPLEEKRREETSNTKTKTHITAHANGDPLAGLKARIPEPYWPTLEGFVRAAQVPIALTTEVGALMDGMHGTYSGEVVGRALLRCATVVGRYDGRFVAKACAGQRADDEAPAATKPRNQVEELRAMREQAERESAA